MIYKYYYPCETENVKHSFSCCFKATTANIGACTVVTVHWQQGWGQLQLMIMITVMITCLLSITIMITIIRH